jgi:DNA-binding MarR family transcriptional regulator
MTATDDPARDAWRLVQELAASGDVVDAEHDLMHALGLSAGPVRALRALDDGGPQSMTALAGRMRCDRSYVTGLVRTLQDRALVTTGPAPGDGRVKIIGLTAEGQAAARRAHEVHARPATALAALPARDLAELRRILRRALEAAGEGATG